MQKLAPVFIICAGMLWGTMGLFIRVFNGFGLDSVQISEIRAVFSFLEIALLLCFWNKKYLHVKWRDIWIFACCGICSVAFFNICYFKTIELLSLSAAAVLLYTAPAFVLIMSAVFFAEKINGRKILAVLVTFMGCTLVSGVLSGRAAVSLVGIFCGLGAGFGYALYSIFSRLALNRGYDSLTITAYSFLFAAIGCFFLTDFTGVGVVIAADPWRLLYFVFYSLFTGVLPFVLYTKGLLFVENSQASVMATVEPVVATLLGFIVFNEVPTVASCAGIILVVLGIVLMSIKSKRLLKAGSYDPQ